jgi:hypothetical protein
MIHSRLRRMDKKNILNLLFKTESRPVFAGTDADWTCTASGCDRHCPALEGVSIGFAVTRSIILVRKLGQRTLPPKYNNGKNHDLFQIPYFCRCQHSV